MVPLEVPVHLVVCGWHFLLENVTFFINLMGLYIYFLLLDRNFVNTLGNICESIVNWTDDD